MPIEVLNACAETPGTWVPSTTVFERAGVEPPSGRGALAGFGYSVRTTFGRCNPPWETEWHVGGENLSYYSLDIEATNSWHEAVAFTAEPEPSAEGAGEGT